MNICKECGRNCEVTYHYGLCWECYNPNVLAALKEENEVLKNNLEAEEKLRYLITRKADKRITKLESRIAAAAETLELRCMETLWTIEYLTRIISKAKCALTTDDPPKPSEKEGGDDADGS